MSFHTFGQSTEQSTHTHTQHMYNHIECEKKKLLNLMFRVNIYIYANACIDWSPVITKQKCLIFNIDLNNLMCAVFISSTFIY